MKRWRLILGGFAGAALLAALAGGAWVYSLGPAAARRGSRDLARGARPRGQLLRAYATSEGRWRLPATVKDVDPRFLELLFAYEDKRFCEHHGVDPLALGARRVSVRHAAATSSPAARP